MDHFDDNTALILHHRAQEPCPLREWVVSEGVDEEQKEKLRRIGQVRVTERALLRCGAQSTLLTQPILTRCLHRATRSKSGRGYSAFSSQGLSTYRIICLMSLNILQLLTLPWGLFLNRTT